jgi:hypothetical protein
MYFTFLFVIFGSLLLFDNIEFNNCKDFALADIIELDESTHFIGRINLNIDDYGNFLLSDTQLKNVKIYDNNGNLKTVFGQEGRGPGDFEFPTHTIRRQNLLYTVEIHGKLTVWDKYSKNVIEIFNLPLMGVNKIMFYDDNHIIANGTRTGQPINNNQDKAYRLHLISLKTGSVINSFFSLPEEYKSYKPFATVMPTLINFLVNREKIIVNYGLGNQVIEFNKEFEIIRDLKLPIDTYFESILDSKIDVNSTDRNTLFTSFSFIENIFTFSESAYIIQVTKNIELNMEAMMVDRQHWFLYVNNKSRNVCQLPFEGAVLLVNNQSLYIYNEEKSSITKYKLK